MGIGIPSLVYTIRYGTPFLFTLTPDILIPLVGLGISLLLTLIVVPFNRFRLSRPHAIVLLVLYVASLVLSILQGVGVLGLPAVV